MRFANLRVALSANQPGIDDEEPAVSWSALSTVVDAALASYHSERAQEAGKGKKRRAPSPIEAPSTKKLKRAGDAGAVNHHPVFCQRYQLQYHRHGEDVPAAATQIIDALRADFENLDTDVSLDLAGLSIEEWPQGARLHRNSDNEYILYLPPPATSNDHFFRWLCTMSELNPGEGSAKVSANARVVVPARTAFEEDDQLPFRIEVDVTLSLVAPAIFDEPELKNKAKRETYHGARSKVLQLAFPAPPLAPELAAAYGDRTNIPFFYAAVRPAPPLSEQAMAKVQPDDLTSTLLPFQRRSVGWLLEREGKTIDDAGKIVSAADVVDEDKLPLLWERVKLGGELVWYYHRLTATIIDTFPVEDPPLPGGILAEEPGLGKTLECISLMLLNPGLGREPTQTHWNASASMDVKHVKSSLIVTPASLLRQWVDEINLHAPTLKVFVYEGWSKLPFVVAHNGLRATPTAQGSSKTQTPEPADGTKLWADFVNQYDVCITTYNVLQQDLNVAHAPPKRPRRATAEYSTPAYQRPRSPLVCVEFFRVIMDEVQMVGGGRALEMVSLIPRHSSLAVSGTPARAAVSDLANVLRYLRSDPLFHSPATWQRLLQPNMVTEFVRLMQYYTCRTMKAGVKDELTIPQQTRFLVPIELGRVERHMYDQELDKCLQELGLDARGVAATENWEIDTNLLRTWLRKLRQICTHPQVGTLQASNKNAKLGAGVLKSMEEVLADMKEQNWQNLMNHRRAQVEEMARAAQLVQNDRTLPQRYTQALEILQEAEAQAQSIIDAVQAELDAHAQVGDELRAEYAAQRRRDEPAPATDKGKGKARARSPLTDDESDEDDGLPKTPRAKAHGEKTAKLMKRLRDALITLHKTKFLQGDAHHVLGPTHEDAENAAYAGAEATRRNILRLFEESAREAMAELTKDYVPHSTTKRVNKSAFFVTVPLDVQGGIKTAGILKQANAILKDGLNAQATLLWKWRAHLYKLLTLPLDATGSDNADGQEYARTLNTQNEADVYIQAYKALLADRRELLVAERTTLAEHENKEKKKRKTKVASAANADADLAEQAALEAELEMLDDEGGGENMAENLVLFKELSKQRKEIMTKFDGQAVKMFATQAANVAVGIFNKSDPEKIIAQECNTQLKQIIATQGSLNEKLDADLGRFRKAFNERVQYYRQLQTISDSLQEAEWDDSLEDAIAASNRLQAELGDTIKTSKARQRYLQHLTKDSNDEEDGCILCRCEFNRGYLTECAHSFCEDCLKGWLSRGQKVCPVCRVPIDVNNLQRFSVKAPQPAGPASVPTKVKQNGEAAVPLSRRQIDYNYIAKDVRDEIESFEAAGSYGNKIETLVRHLLYLKIADPGAKSIVFSAFEDSLHIVEHALRLNNIPCLRIESSTGTGKGKVPAAVRFKDDPELLVLLLHGERENAGLNVTCASRVFLLESVVHHSFEIQAIARIDRMGQSRPTEVFCYFAQETIERNILDLAARKGLSLYTTEKALGTLDLAPAAVAPDAANNVVDAPSKKKKDQKGDFIFKLDDMMSILFPHLTEDLEYLLPPPEEEMQIDGVAAGSAVTASRVQQNATAGPSRAR